MNGTLLQASQWNATNASYMTGANFTIQNQSLNNYILYVNSTNGAGGSYADAWINATIYNKGEVNDINTSMKNYVDWQNTSVTNALATKLSLSGGTMTGNISLGNNYLTNGTSGGGIIYHNGTGWIIRA
jgi:hypothetical protein